MKRTVVVLLTLGALAYFMARTSRVGLPPKNFGSKIYFIPMGDFPTDQMQRLADYYNQRFGLEIPILKSIPVSVSAVDNNRGQLVAEKLVGDLRNAFPELTADPKAILIGFTSQDMYNLHYMGQPFWGASQEIRLRKMVTKDIGILYYGLSQSDNPKSVLYNSILGIQELDTVSEKF